MEFTLNNTSDDTICAISTPPGSGGIAVIRISGPNALQATAAIWKGRDLRKAESHTAHLGNIIDPADNSTLDQAVATIYKAPASFTGDDTLELSIHGSTYIQQRLLRILTDHCAIRLAQPGEFTKRAFSAGKITLTQAEAVADIIAASSKAAHRIAATQFSGKTHTRLATLRDELTQLAALLELELDFSEEDVIFADRTQLIGKAQAIRTEIQHLLKSFDTGKAIKEGIPIAITGPTNAGKSSLLNQLLDDDRAIVSDIHGTTRDTIEETIPIGDYTFRLIDTAGLRTTDNVIEQLGIQRSHDAIATASIILLVIDKTTISTPDTILDAERNIRNLKRPDAHLITLINKADLDNTPLPPLPTTNATDTPTAADVDRIIISANTGQGIDTLRQHLTTLAATNDNSADIIITNERHRHQLAQALRSITAVINGLTLTPTTDLPTAQTTSPATDLPTTQTTPPATDLPTTQTAPPATDLPTTQTTPPAIDLPTTHLHTPATDLPIDMIATDLRLTIHHLSLLTGDITTPDLLTHIFSHFCIGK